MKVLIAGAGYVGLPLAQQFLKQGHEVTGWVSSESSVERLKEHGIKSLCADLASADAWRNHASKDWDVLVFCASTRGGGVEAYQSIHSYALDLALKASWEKFCYTSSTSVYGEKDGRWVDENTPVNPQTDSAKILAEAERRVLQAGGIVARLSGIYGPHRGKHRRKMNENVIRLEDDPERWLNHVHRDDIVLALQFLIDRGQSGLWNVSDTEPFQLKTLYAWMAEATGKTLEIANHHQQVRTRDTNKRISSQRLQDLGFKFQYPTFREGYRALNAEGV